MVSKMPSGYNTDLFVSEVDENFKCPICFMVLKDPVELACEHAYCKACVLHHLNRGQGALCPQCRHPVGKRSDDSWAYDSPRRNFRNIHSNLRLRCDLDKCKKVCTIAELETHQNSCEFNPNRIIKCPKCQAEICAFDLNKHNCVEYLRARVEILQTTTSILESRIDALESNRVIGIKCVRLPENDKRRMFVESSDVLQDIREMFMKELDCDPWLYGVKCADIDTTSALVHVEYVNTERKLWLNASSTWFTEADFHLNIDVSVDYLWHVGEELVIMGRNESDDTTNILFYDLRKRTYSKTINFLTQEDKVNSNDNIHFLKIQSTWYCYLGDKGKLLEVVLNDKKNTEPWKTLNIPRYYSSVSNIHDQPCFVGGLMELGNGTQPVPKLPLLCYNVLSKHWDENETLIIHPRIKHRSIVHGGKLYVCGGKAQQTVWKALDACNVYDINKGRMSNFMIFEAPYMASWSFSLVIISDIPNAVGLDTENNLVKRPLNPFDADATIADLQISILIGAFTSCDPTTSSKTEKSVSDAALHKLTQHPNLAICLSIIGILTVCVSILSGVTGWLCIINHKLKRKPEQSTKLQPPDDPPLSNMRHPSISFEESEATELNKQLTECSTTKLNSQSLTVSSSSPNAVTKNSSGHDITTLLGNRNLVTKVNAASTATPIECAGNASESETGAEDIIV